MWRGLSG